MTLCAYMCGLANEGIEIVINVCVCVCVRRPNARRAIGFMKGSLLSIAQP